jgi:glycosyltransferase involved in cell wall biosynthesis
LAPEVSVLIPSYNHAHYLVYALYSVVSQSFSDWEAIVIDDGSTDDTQVVTAQFVDPRIRYIYQENHGLSAARNTGIREADSENIALLDADDIWQNDYLETMVTPLINHPELVAVYCGFQYIDQDGHEVGIPSLKVVPPEEFREYFANNGNWLVPSGVVFRKVFAEKEGCFDESLRAVEDGYLWSKLSRNGPFMGIPLPLVGYRRHDSNMSNDPQRMVSSKYKILERYHGSPQGDTSTWSERKKRSYTRYFKSASIRYLAFSDMQMSAYFFLRMQEITPEAGTEIGIWRSLARVHLPIEIRNAPDAIEWQSAERDVLGLLAELEKMRPDSKTLDERYSMIAGSAYLALADEAFRARQFNLAYKWMWIAFRMHTGILFSRPYWGTLVRGINGAGNVPG